MNMTQQLTEKHREMIGPVWRVAVEVWEDRGYTVNTSERSNDHHVYDLYLTGNGLNFRLLSNGTLVAHKPFYQSHHVETKPGASERMIEVANDWLKIAEDRDALLNFELLIDIVNRIHQAPLTYKLATSTKEIEALNDAAHALVEIAGCEE